MSVLNEKTEETVKRIHLLTTRLCTRNCPNCCNNLFPDDMIPSVTDEELKLCEYLFLTGGEPFQFSNPNEIADYYKSRYKNIKKVIVYTNAKEFYRYLIVNGDLSFIDGVSVSIKTLEDAKCFKLLKDHPNVLKCTDNYLYIFNNILDDTENVSNFKCFERAWQTLDEYKPAPDSIFRKI